MKTKTIKKSLNKKKVERIVENNCFITINPHKNIDRIPKYVFKSLFFYNTSICFSKFPIFINKNNEKQNEVKNTVIIKTQNLFSLYPVQNEKTSLLYIILFSHLYFNLTKLSVTISE